VGNVVEFKSNDEFKHVSYIDNEGDLGVCSLDRKISIARLNNNEFLVGDKLIDRETLAEFLWVAATFVDSKEKWRPNLDLIGSDY